MVANDYPEPPQGSVCEYFPLKQVGPEPHTFEIALVLGGTVSAGTYTAGVIDFLVEALDQWLLARQAEDQANPPVRKVPRHRVILRVMTGSSGGGIIAALAARALSFSFPPASFAAPDHVREQNPLFALSVNTVDFAGLLGTSDLKGATVPSLLCSRPIHEGVKKALDFVGTAPPGRDYLVNPLPVFLTLTNVAGIPYKLDFSGAAGRSEYFVDHADYQRLAVRVDGVVAPPDYPPMPDALAIPVPVVAGDWKFLQPYLLGTAAFPIGFPPVQICRSVEDYRFRYVTWADAEGKAHTDWLTPDWRHLITPETRQNNQYRFLSLDGGCTDNQPIELARTWLAGIESQNPRDGGKACRAVILIDPFSEIPGKAIVENPGLPGMLGPIAGVFIQSSRYATADLSPFINPDVYSRFLVTPVRSDPGGGHGVLTGGDAIAGSRLGAFMGYLSKKIRVHDFMLGRRNCQAFLQSWFTLPGHNKLFYDATPEPDTSSPPNTEEVPIIPLCGSAAVIQPEPQWPRDTFNLDDIGAQIESRTKALLRTTESRLTSNPVLRLILDALNFIPDGVVAKEAIKAIDAELKRAPGLLSD